MYTCTFARSRAGTHTHVARVYIYDSSPTYTQHQCRQCRLSMLVDVVSVDTSIARYY
eukprot:COSAG02_NODE_178_length_31091_cov_59.242482_5_plen_57_part_00